MDINPKEAEDARQGQLFEENRELGARLQFITNRQDALEERLQRVENSVLFRFLRWLGPKLTAVGLPVPGATPLGADQNYSLWLDEIASRPVIGQDTLPNAETSPTLCIVLNAPSPDRARLEAALNALSKAQSPHFPLLILADSPAPVWLKGTIEQHLQGRAFRIVPGGTTLEGFKAALQECQEEFIAIVSSDAVLYPTAIPALMSAAEPDAIAVYCDWDYIGRDGHQHTPRFTPENSPELLSQILYWGKCYLVRTRALRDLNWADQDAGLALEHQLAILLAAGGTRVQRVPRILWHLQDGADDPLAKSRRQSEASHAKPEGARTAVPSLKSRPALRASVVICSRNAKLLGKCLKRLSATLGPGDEVIVVAHQREDTVALQQVSSAYGARMVPYRGSFHFGLMNRLGVDAAGAPMICLLNDDVCPITGDWLSMMHSQASKPEVGIVGALLLYPNHTIEHAGIAVGGRHLPAHVGRCQNDSPYWPWLRVTREVTAVTGACMVMRRSVWDELDGFDDRFPVNFNDVDLCLRAARRGYKVLIEARAVLTHEGAKTRNPVIYPQEHELLYRLWGPVMRAPDRFFNPQFGNTIEPILLGPLNGGSHVLSGA
jgi:O-antigen biosynthesis protein